MKKLIFLLLAISMLFPLSGCRFDMRPQRIVEWIDSAAEKLGSPQLTCNLKLVGKREFGFDRYIGDYTANCKRADGEEVIFGGTSVKGRKVKLTAFVRAKSGSVAILVQSGASVFEYAPDENGLFEKEFTFDGGGCYISLDYDKFSGALILSSEYTD